MSVTIPASTEMRKLIATLINTPDQNIQLSCLTIEVVCKMWYCFFAFAMSLLLNFFRVSYTCSGCFELFCMSYTVSENLPGTFRYLGTYKNSVLIFNDNYLSMCGIERVKRPKQELIETFSFQVKLLLKQMKAMTGPQQWARQSSQLVLLSNIVLQSQDQLKKLKMQFQKLLTKERKLFLL